VPHRGGQTDEDDDVDDADFINWTSAITADFKTQRRVQTCSEVAISTKGWLNRVFVDNNHPHDSLVQRCALYHHISVHFSVKSDRKSTKML